LVAPILGDPKYGNEEDKSSLSQDILPPERMMLHSSSLTLQVRVTVDPLNLAKIDDRDSPINDHFPSSFEFLLLRSSYMPVNESE
jgi:hypothetical protein